MTALVSSQSAFLLDPARDPPSGGILLNSRSVSAPLGPQHMDHTEPSSFASSSSSASQTSQSHSRSSTFGDASSRKIRFAPLPSPRSFPDVFYQDDSDSDSKIQLPYHATPPANYSPIPPSPANSAHSLPESALHSDDATFREKPAKAKSKKWGRKLLRPLLPLMPSNSNKTEECSPSLFRTPSRDSTKANGHGNPHGNPADDDFKGGVPLGRRMSTGSRNIASQKETERSQTFRGGAPLVPVMSENGGGSKGRKDGQRMLNGRVYGRRPSSVDREREEKKRSQAANDPEFVEWGYGGMGSVNNDHPRGRATTAGPDWGKVQSRGKVLGGGEDFDPEGDDGSGMGWVKKRRQQREREKREQEERDKTRKEQAVPGIEVHPPEPKEQQAQAQEPARTNESADKEEEQHVYRAVSVPAPHHHHTRHHSYKSDEASGTATPTSAPALSRANSTATVPLSRVTSPGSQSEGLLTPGEKKTESESSSGSGSSVMSAASTTSSESLDDEEDDNVDEDTERESDDDEEDDEESRLTCKGAGVEKISRHKD